MRPIANILFNDELINHIKVDYVNYYEGYAIDEDAVDYNLPTLYVGWGFFKNSKIKEDKKYGVSILEKEIIINRLYWEFSFNENKAQHVDGVDEFVRNAPVYFFKPKYNYTNFDPIFFNVSNISELINLFPKTVDAYYCYKNKVSYLLFENKIIGVDLTMYEYFDFDVNEIINKIKERSHKTIIDVDGGFYQKYYKIFPNFDYLKRYLVVLLFN